MKVCQSAIVPMFPVYDYDKHCLDIYIHPPMNDLAQADNHYIARRMNEEIEVLVSPYPEQQTWILKLIKTRRQGEIDSHVSKNLSIDSLLTLLYNQLGKSVR